MLERKLVDTLIERADKACRTKNSEDGLAPEEVLTVLMEYKDLIEVVEQAQAEGYRTPQTKMVDKFLADFKARQEEKAGPKWDGKSWH